MPCTTPAHLPASRRPPRRRSRCCNGLTLEQAAEEPGISKNTARTHLRAIFSKTGATRQATLVRILLGSVVPLGSRVADPSESAGIRLATRRHRSTPRVTHGDDGIMQKRLARTTRAFLSFRPADNR
ncbi:hypothetical protein EMIT0111MI5_10306 [Burkholderia sp. IT-111MI5]